MISRVRAALDTYHTRPAFQIYAAALIPILVISYLVLYRPAADPSAAYLAAVAPAGAIFFALLGEHMKIQSASWRLRLSPGYALTHLAAACLMTSIFVLSLVLMMLAFLRTPPDVSGPMLAVGWALALAALSAGYFFVPQSVFLLVIATMNGTLVGWVAEIDRSAALVILAADLVLTAAVLKRMLSATEESFEYQGKDTPQKFERHMWTRFSRRSWTHRLSWRREHVLDRPHVLTGDVMSHVRHFASGIRTSQQSFLIMTATWAGVFWALNLFTRQSSSIIPDAIVLTPIPAMAVFMQTERGAAANLQSIFLLPLRREQIVSRYGLALLLVLLEDWLAFAIGLILVSWMPFPGRVLAFPSMGPFLISLVAQLPIFGLLGLGFGRSRIYMIGLTSLAVMIVALLSSAGLQWALIAAFISGPPVIWYAYRHWCRAELP